MLRILTPVADVEREGTGEALRSPSRAWQPPKPSRSLSGRDRDKTPEAHRGRPAGGANHHFSDSPRLVHKLRRIVPLKSSEAGIRDRNTEAERPKIKWFVNTSTLRSQ